MTSTPPVFRAPDDVRIPVWRYMDFTKYVAMLGSRSLYFARADQLDDRFEGSTTKATLKARPEWYKGPEFAKAYIEELIPRLNEWSKRWTYVNCWHANEGESAAMWRLYARSHEAIAIRSTFAKLAGQMPEHTAVGMVEYIDYEEDVIPESNLFYRFLRKRKSFAHEREVRAVRQDPIIEGGTMLANKENPELAKLAPVDLAVLIEHVYVAPTAPDWFRSLVAEVTKRYGFEFPVRKSSLDDDPVY